jgi:phenylpyruvate tautomerase PptA (4-oxalocrotonate tautomerase family)
MPLIRINCPENSLTAEQKEQLSPLLIDALMRQEVDPVTEAGKAPS